VPLLERVAWETLENYTPDFPHVVLADLQSEQTSLDESERNKQLLELDAESADLEQIQFAEGDLKVDMSYSDEVLNRRYRVLSAHSQSYTEFTLNPGCREAVVVVGGETEGVSDSAYKFCHKLNGSRLHIPLRNGMNSLNVVSAASIVLFRVQQSLL